MCLQIWINNYLNCFENTSLTYMVNGKQLVVKKGQQPVANENIKQEKRRRITGTVIDTEGEPLIGVNIMQEGLHMVLLPIMMATM